VHNYGLIFVTTDDRAAASLNRYLAGAAWSGYREFLPLAPEAVACTPGTLPAALTRLAEQTVKYVTLLPWSLDGEALAMAAWLPGWQRDYPGLELRLGAAPVTGVLLAEAIWRGLEAASPESFADYRETLATPRAIEERSLALIGRLLETTSFTPEQRKLVKRLVHAGGDPWLIGAVEFHPSAISAACRAIKQRASVYTDVNMVKAGINRRFSGHCRVISALEQPGLTETARRKRITRSRAAFESLDQNLDGALVAIGNAPTALLALLDLAGAGRATPACVIGMPVGFVQARESKERLRLAGLPYITIRGFRGGSAMAAAAVNALWELAEEDAAA